MGIFKRLFGEKISGKAFFDAIERGDIKTVKNYIGKGGNIDTRNFFTIKGNDCGSITGLILASLLGKVEIVRLLLGKGAKVDKKSRDGRTALMYVCRYAYKKIEGSVEIIKLLLMYGADSNIEGDDGGTPLLYICGFQNNIDTFDEYRKTDGEKGVPLGYKSSIKNGSYINDQIKIIELLLEKGADIDKEGKSGKTALFVASSLGNIEIISHLIKKGADINKEGKFGMTPLFVACGRMGNIEIVSHLIKKGADIDQQCDCGMPLAAACYSNQNAVVKLLLEKGANPWGGDIGNIFCNPMRSATSSGNIEAKNLLIKYYGKC